MENQPLNVDSMNLKTTKQALETSHTDRLSDTAEVVREVSKKIGNIYFLAWNLIYILTLYSLGKTKVKWDNPKTVMVITKPGDVSLISMTRELALWFMKTSKTCQRVKV